MMLIARIYRNIYVASSEQTEFWCVANSRLNRKWFIYCDANRGSLSAKAYGNPVPSLEIGKVKRLSHRWWNSTIGVGP